ncbi:MAG TPA: ribosome small subunit-dependent GTPase A [Polyangiaceae bacterium]|nr:ribosome small subunit-dependent GTPase A [Polyangiaceae bacterium]
MNFDRSESLQRLGFSTFFQTQFQALLAMGGASPEARVARVLSEARGQYLVSDGDEPQPAVLAGRLKHAGTRICVGDFVLLEDAPGNTLCRIEHAFERSSLFQRRPPGGTSEAQLIAANVDLAIVVCALAPEDADPHAQGHGLNPRRIERYLRAIRDAPARALVLLNKADLSPLAAQHEERLRAELRGVPVLLASAEHGSGLTELTDQLGVGTTAVLVGSSGVGKSSLTNRLLQSSAQTVQPVRARDTRGRHTTTGREIFVLPSGGLLIDTPGMREFSLFADEDTELGSTGFAEIDALAPACRFRDCRHRSEPGCAVLAAVELGSVAGERLDQAHKFERELSWQRDRHDPLRMREALSLRRARTRSLRAGQKERPKS